MLKAMFKFIVATSLAGGLVCGAVAQAHAALTPHAMITKGSRDNGVKDNGTQVDGPVARFARLGTERSAAE